MSDRRWYFIGQTCICWNRQVKWSARKAAKGGQRQQNHSRKAGPATPPTAQETTRRIRGLSCFFSLLIHWLIPYFLRVTSVLPWSIGISWPDNKKQFTYRQPVQRNWKSTCTYAGLIVQMKQQEEENSKCFQEQLSQELAKLKVSVETAELPPAEPYIAGRERRWDCSPGAMLCKESKQKGI